MPDLFEIVDAGFDRAEQYGDAAVVWRHATPDGREAAVSGARLCIGAPGEPRYGDGYCYATTMGAVLSAARWIEAGCGREPDGWTSHPQTGRNRPDGAARPDERAWVCPRHPDRLPSFERGHLFCPVCARRLTDAIHVPWPPAAA
jgi:hypothetical protein